MSDVIARGVEIGVGAVDPGLGFYRNVADGEGEALLMKARRDAARDARNG